MAALPNLGIIAAFGAGVDKIDLTYARAHGIRVANAPDPTVGCVADMAMALLLALARGIVPGGLALDRAGNLYVSVSGDGGIRRLRRPAPDAR